MAATAAAAPTPLYLLSNALHAINRAEREKTKKREKTECVLQSEILYAAVLCVLTKIICTHKRKPLTYIRMQNTSNSQNQILEEQRHKKSSKKTA